MKPYSILVLAFALVLNITYAVAQIGNMDWTQATAHAGWSERFGHTSVVYDNKMWVMGGNSENSDVWNSSDGVNWTQVTINAGWSARNRHTSVVFNNKMWVMGGYSGVNKNDVWNSSDGVNWTQVTANGGWSERFGHTSVVYDNKMWVMGGFADIHKNEVWNSTDGVNWTQVTANAGWSERFGHTSLVYDNKMWVMGGNGENSDVWNSSDGVNWTQATINAEWSARLGHTSIVFDNKMWVMGGFAGVDKNDVWNSSDGVNWAQATVNAGWSERYEPTSVVFQNKIWVLGGGKILFPLDKNDVWYSMFSITLLSPSGGEFWSGGRNQIIKWRTIGSDFAHYRLLLSKDGGSTYTDTIAQTIAASETTYNWATPIINTSTWRMMVQIIDSVGTVITQDASDANFIIDYTPPNSFTLISPSNGACASGTPTFDWQDATDALSGIKGYSLWIDIG